MDNNSGSIVDAPNHQDQMEEVLPANKSKAAAATAMAERKPRPKPEQKVDCPRCKSANTKFCYYNNYSMSQPRYFCKACRRYWTHGGSLRNIPIGGGCRKNRRSSSSDVNNKLLMPPEPTVPSVTCLGFPNVLPTFISTGFELPGIRDHRHLSLAFVPSSSPVTPRGTTPSFMDVLRGGILDGGYGGGNTTPGMVQMPSSAITYGGPILQHGTIGGAQGVLNGHAIGTGEEGIGGDNNVKTMMGVQWQPQFGGGGTIGSGTEAQVQVQLKHQHVDGISNIDVDVDNNGGSSSSRDCYNWSNGEWQGLINTNNSQL